MYKVELTYFKDTGKYYAEGVFETPTEALFEIWDLVELMPKHPGLIGRWEEGPILVNVPGHPNEHPRLIHVGRMGHKK